MPGDIDDFVRLAEEFAHRILDVRRNVQCENAPTLQTLHAPADHGKEKRFLPVLVTRVRRHAVVDLLFIERWGGENHVNVPNLAVIDGLCLVKQHTHGTLRVRFVELDHFIVNGLERGIGIDSDVINILRHRGNAPISPPTRKIENPLWFEYIVHVTRTMDETGAHHSRA
jgi:hypothetical protein